MLRIFAQRHGYTVEVLPAGEIPFGQTWTCSVVRRRLWVTEAITAEDTALAIAWMRRYDASDGTAWCCTHAAERPDSYLAG